MKPPATPNPGDAVHVIRLYKSEDKIHPRAVDGFFARWRWAMVAITQAVFYGLPWLTWGDRPAVLFDLASRRFYVFGLVLYPQDFVYLTALLLMSAYALFLFTAVAGRVWCGYACPQTVYTELFVRIEHWFEGDRNARLKLDKAGWSWNKLWRKGGKQVAWIALALFTGLSFVGYFTPIRELLTFSMGGWEAFWVLFYGFATYGNAGYMREQVCKYMCPYARFQSAMFDRDTLIVSYDPARGEPRGRNAERGRKGSAQSERSQAVGDCIDCHLCVHVCPTGIDIRKGLQYECISCAACIDVCDGVMDKMGTPRGLIRYDTENGMAGQLTRAQRWRRVFRPRVLIYGSLLLALGVAVLWSLASRHDFRVDIVRDRATLARQVEDGWIENLYRLQLMNATEAPQQLSVAADGLPGLQLSRATRVTLGPAEARWVTVALRLPPESASQIKPGAQPIRWVVRSAGGDSVAEKSTFVVPR